MSESREIIIQGARVHNLKNISVAIPKNRLVVITGPSGSGKSSLAFDTIYAEGQRRYVESLSAYARQFLDQMQKPDVDVLEGLSPAIAIEQKTLARNPRSTVATTTEIYDYLRVLFARTGIPFCWNCGREISSQTVQEMVDHVMRLQQGEKIVVLAPIVRGRKGEFKKELRQLRKDGFIRARINGGQVDLGDDISLDKKKAQTIEVIVDRLVVKETIAQRLADSLQTAVSLGDGLVLVAPVEGRELVFSEKLACPECGISYPELSPRSFSFNSPYGACEACSGLGACSELDPDLIIPDGSLSINQGAIAPWSNPDSFYVRYLCRGLADHYGFSLDTPFEKLPQRIRSIVLNGSGGEAIAFEYRDEKRLYRSEKPFQGILASLNKRYRETGSEQVRDDIGRYMNRQPCPDCGGGRLRKESLWIRIDGKSIADVCALSVSEAICFLEGVSFTPARRVVADPLVREIRQRLGFLEYLGLGYLTLNRAAGTLSGGESHRISLAAQLGTRLTGVVYVLDEPSVGLHARDSARLLDILRQLRDIGNSVLVVEHDEESIRAADYIVDLGPGAGVAGGRVVAAGTPGDVEANSVSLTGRYLSGLEKIKLPELRRTSEQVLRLEGASKNNLKNIGLDIPLGVLTCVTGVSGSGKSSLVFDSLLEALRHPGKAARGIPGAARIHGSAFIDKIIHVDQAPIGRTPRSNPATFTGIFNHVRDIFTQLPEAKLRGYKPGRFSFNVKGGRCEACQGDGVLKIEMHFLPDMYVTCDVCQGRRYNRETLEVRYRGKNIADVLDMTVREALVFFENIPALHSRLQVLCDVGLDYIALGQPAPTLSGGEAQRIKLSRELAQKGRGHTLYILDEPTTGLHFADVARLLDVLDSLVERGNSVIVIEHNMDVIKTADYVIDLGPEGGDAGGYLVAAGTPEEIARQKSSITGRFLKKYLESVRAE
jgi:excinuclease ABC subunit A